MSDPKQETQENRQSPDVTPPGYGTFRKSIEWDIPGRLSDLESEFVRLNATLENFATKSDLRDLKDELSKEIAGMADKLTAKITSSNRFIVGSFLTILAIIATITVLVLNWLWDLRGNAPIAPVAPVVNFYTTEETPRAFPPQAEPAVTRHPARQPPSLAAETAPAPSAPASGPPETGSTAG
ncbi:MAG: hypothetical protein LBT40_07830 [Deltaproteobacteria bacterium]|jgi:hypothetical protein|nr:hypothetical protein [Deltaproteobacteria bacterium]